MEAVVAAAAAPPTPFGPGDDAAVLPAARGRRVVTSDALVEGVHFLRAHPPEALGWKAVAVNLSDVASMGARPEGFVLSAAVPEDLPARWWRGFARGLAACARWGGAALVGGDTVRSPGPLMLTVTAWGALPEGDAALLRHAGEPGDTLLVRGDVGRSGLGLRRWLEAASGRAGWAEDHPVEDAVLQAHLRPRPPLEAGPAALALGARAGMDLSDGLAVDLPRLARASEVTLVVDLDRLPADPLLAGVSAVARASGGEDYALVVLAPPERVAKLVAEGFAPIGEARQSRGGDPPGVLWRLGGRPVDPALTPFEHF
ncbi:MAG: thiamine-phosphate kinase [Deltaproteobacteria bacterium]|nr:MAG: thiamine-phosphate kinase [Deltaproteobacteria bacterium]